MSPREIDRSGAPTDPRPEAAGRGERIARLILARTPLGALVRRVARIRASVHAKLLGAFLLIVLLLMAIGAVSLQAITAMSRQARRLDQARARVDASRQIEYAVGVQMNVTRTAVTLRDQATLDSIVRASNPFTDTLAGLEKAARPGERETIQEIRAAEDQIVRTVGQIAHLIRNGEADEAMTVHLNEGYPLYREIAKLVTRVVRAEEEGMEELRQNVEATNRRAV